MPEYLIVNHNVEKPDLYGEYACASAFDSRLTFQDGAML
jgi:hypothetical protein